MADKQKNNEYVYLECVKISSKLRVRVISPGYNKVANCQFPTALRKAGRKFRVPSKYLNFGAGSRGTFFYKVNKKDKIEIVDDATANAALNINPLDGVIVYEEEDCTVCFSEKPQIVYIPCGHFSLCADCDKGLKYRKCPSCMNPIEMSVHSDQIK